MPSPIWAAVVVLSLAQLLGLLVVAVSGARKPAETLTWITFCLLVPLLGVPLYFILTGRVPKRPNLPWEQSSQRTDDIRQMGVPPINLPQMDVWKAEVWKTDVWKTEVGLMDTAVDADVRTMGGSQTRKVIQFAIRGFASRGLMAAMEPFYAGDDFYQAMLQDMKRARYSIDVEFYIFRYDEVGRAIVQLLLEKARHGIKVRFLRDGLGSRQFPQSVVQELSENGVECRVFSPLRAPFLTRRLNHRDHCKIVVIDQTIAYTGGMNVGREYAGRDPKYGSWRDTSTRIATAARLPLCDLFEANFRIAEKEFVRQTGKRVKSQRRGECFKTVDAESNVLAISPFRCANADGQAAIENRMHSKQSLQGEIQFLQSGPDTKQNLRELYFLCLTQAKRQVEITTPYFLPESDLTMALKTAVSRGVKVRLLLPERVDHRIIGMACQTYFPPLLDAGIEIYLYRPGVLHAKVMTVDSDVAIVGAANYDLRSFRLNYEVCLVQYGYAVTHQLRSQFEQDLRASRRLLRNDLHTSPTARLKHLTARLAAPLC